MLTATVHQRGCDYFYAVTRKVVVLTVTVYQRGFDYF